MRKCSNEKNKICKEKDKICNEISGRCIKPKIGKVENNDISIIYKINNYRHREKMAIFDYDWTLVKPRTNGVFAKNEDDWIWLTENVPIKLKEFYNKGYSINIITNQRKNTASKIRELHNSLSSLNIPIIFIVGIDKIIAKPNISIFEKLIQNKKYDKENTFYVGDALGREGDWSDVDKKFAENIGIKYYSPDELFSIKSDKKIIIPENINQEIIVLVGYPGSGKSTISNTFDKSKYVTISGDEFKTSKRMIKEADKYIIDGKSIIFDATNANIEKRKEYIDFAVKNNIESRCINVKTDIVESMFRNNKRNKIIPKITYYVFRKKYQEPTIEEWFKDIINI